MSLQKRRPFFLLAVRFERAKVRRPRAAHLASTIGARAPAATVRVAPLELAAER
jgi:hypothetical protein